MLFGVEPVDPLSLSVAGTLIGAVGCWRRCCPPCATWIDPVRALTAE